MNQVDGKQMDIHRGTVCQTASTMTALQAVTPGLLTKDGTNHGTLGWHCQHRSSLDRSATLCTRCVEAVNQATG